MRSASCRCGGQFNQRLRQVQHPEMDVPDLLLGGQASELRVRKPDSRCRVLVLGGPAGKCHQPTIEAPPPRVRLPAYRWPSRRSYSSLTTM